MTSRKFPAQPLIWVWWKTPKHKDRPNSTFLFSSAHLVTKDHKRTAACHEKIMIEVDRKPINDIPPDACKQCTAIAKGIMIANLERRIPSSIVKAAMAQ